jgi:hypothetical protein
VGKGWTWVAWSMLAIVVGSVALLVALSGFMVVGVLILAHRPGNTMGWIFSAIGLLGVTSGLGVEYAVYAYVTRPGSLPAAIVAAWSSLWLWFPTVALMLVFTPLLFPPVGCSRAAGGPSPGWRQAGRRCPPSWPL